MTNLYFHINTYHGYSHYGHGGHHMTPKIALTIYLVILITFIISVLITKLRTDLTWKEIFTLDIDMGVGAFLSIAFFYSITVIYLLILLGIGIYNLLP